MTENGSLEFAVRRHQLVALTEWVAPVVPSGTTLAVNSCIKVTVAPGLLRLAGTDQQRAVITETPAVTAEAAGEVFLPARKLKAILAEAPDGDVTVSVKANMAVLTAGGAHWDLKLPPPDRYSELPDLSAAEFALYEREALLAALNTVKHAVGRDAGRPAYSQVHIAESDGIMWATATDSSQFSRAKVPGFPVPLLVPGIALDEVLRLLGKSPDEKVGVASVERFVAFRAGPVTMTALHMPSKFPDVASQFLNPVRQNDLTLTVEKGDLAGALRRVRINADPNGSPVALTADEGTLTVMAQDGPGGNRAEEVIAAEWDGGPQLVVVNARFLEAMLAVHPPAMCEFRLRAPRGRQLAPLLLSDPESGVTGICPLMPPSMVGY